MPELFLDIKLGLDDSTKRTVQSEIQDIQDKANQAAKGGTEATQKQTKATKAQVDAEKELIQEFRRKMTLNEVQFRQGKLSQQQAIEAANAIEQQALEQGILTNETLQGVRAQKSMFLSQQRISTGFTGMAATSQRANQSLMNIGRIVQDLPFGFLGISNNIDPALNSFRALQKEAGGTMGALKLLGGSLMGSGGLIFALGSLLPTAILIATQGFNMYRKRTDEVEDSTSKLTETVRSFISESAGLRSSSSFLDIDRLQRQIDAIDRLEFGMNAIREQQEDINKANEVYARVSADVTSFQSEYKDNLDAEKEALKEIEKQYGLNADQLEIIKQRQKELNNELAVSRALLKADPAAQFRQGIEQTTEEFIWQAENSFILSSRLKQQAEVYRLQAKNLREAALTNEDARIKYNALNEAIDELNSAYDELNPKQKESKKNTEDEADAILEWAAAYQKRIEATRKFRIEQQKLIESLPKGSEEDFGPESRGLARTALIEQLQSDRQISQAEGLAQRKLEIEREFQDRVMSLGRQGLLDGDVLRELELTKQQQLEDAKTEIAKQGEEKRKQLRQQALESSFAMANNLISSLMQLNQSQSDESEEQARKRFETQKKLQKAQAVVAGAAAIVKTFSEWGFPFGIPFAAAQAAATAVQIAAIERTKFNSANQSDSGTPQMGFFETDTRDQKGHGEPIRPINQNSVDVNLRFADDADEILSAKVERGNDKRKRGTTFTVEV